jgi:hypothetical protein
VAGLLEIFFDLAWSYLIGANRIKADIHNKNVPAAQASRRAPPLPK